MQSDFARQLCTELHTPRLLLRPRIGSHAEAAFEPLQDDALYQWMSARKPESAQWLTQRWARLESRLSLDGAETWLAWTVFLRSSGAHIGQVDAVVDEDRVCTKGLLTNNLCTST
jgi:RimJ/RimL family protein N-acetyltransferase